MKKFLVISALIFAVPALAEDTPKPPDPTIRMGAIIQQLDAQRNSALDNVAVCAGDLSLANRKIAELNAQIIELQKEKK